MPEKYVLSEGAKAFARMIVQEWDAGRAEQEIGIIITQGAFSGEQPRTFAWGADRRLPAPTAPIVKELVLNGLVHADIDGGKITVTLLESLRHAVASDFTRPQRDPSSVNTTYNIQQGDGSTFNTFNAAGNITVNMEMIADRVRHVLGEEILAADPELKTAIDELAASDEESQPRRIGNFLSALGRSAGHTANVLTIMQVLDALAKSIRL